VAERNHKLMGLTTEQVQALLAKKRTKGLYEDRLVELTTESDEMGVNPVESWPLDFNGKSATTMYQGFRNAATKLGISEDIDVIQRDGAVFLLVKSRCAGVLGGDATEDTTSEDSNEEILIATSNGDGPVTTEA